MEKQRKRFPISIIVISCCWILFGLITYFIRIFKCESLEKDEWFYLLYPHITFFLVLLIFLIFSILYSKEQRQKDRIRAEEQLKENEFKRKEEWEWFQYELYKDENIEKDKYKRFESIVNALESKVDPKDEEIKKLKEELKKEKERIDKEVTIKVAGDLGINLREKEVNKKVKSDKPKKS